MQWPVKNERKKRARAEGIGLNVIYLLSESNHRFFTNDLGDDVAHATIPQVDIR